MARLFNGTNDSIEGASAPVTAAPLTIAAWFYTTTSVNQVIVSVGVSGGIHRFQLNTDFSNSKPAAVYTHDGTVSESNFTGSGSLNQWHHAAGVFASTSSRLAYFNGSTGTINTETRTPTGINRINIGARYNTTLGAYFVGSIAEVGVWNAALTADEIASLAKGFPCRLVRPSALQFYSRLIRNVMDIRNGITLSELGTGTSQSDHPRIIYPC